jgi:hypothetical protein
MLWDRMLASITGTHRNLKKVKLDLVRVIVLVSPTEPSLAIQGNEVTLSWPSATGQTLNACSGERG